MKFKYMHRVEVIHPVPEDPAEIGLLADWDDRTLASLAGQCDHSDETAYLATLLDRWGDTHVPQSGHMKAA